MTKVLITNDDGIDSSGLKALAEALKPLADVYVVAPAEEQSGKSQSITFLHPLKVEKRDMKGVAAAYAAHGTPADCIKVGLCILEREGIRPDYVISGINLGYNTGLAVYYSGTLAAAREGALNGIRSIALSVGSHMAKEFDYILGMLPMLMEMSDKVGSDVIISVNAPEVPAGEIKGYKIVDTAPAGCGLNFVFEEVGEGLYQMTGRPAPGRIGVEYDIDVVEDNYVAVSPVPTSISDKVSLARLQGAYAKDEILSVIVDAQEDVLDEIEGRDKLAKKIETFVHASARMDLPILFTKAYGKGDLIGGIFDMTTRCEIAEHMKTDPWTANDMSSHTAMVDAKKVIIAGAETHLSLMQTALGFLEKGYEVTVLEDCTAAFDSEEHKKAIKELKDAGAEIAGLKRKMMEIADTKELYVRESIERILK
ncbi:MAG: 5'/3'-nucleotidase SurE [Mogibacterium sp.]|nr:5'/3'-nucleotidase SurE [Mogibacterium sp.]